MKTLSLLFLVAIGSLPAMAEERSGCSEFGNGCATLELANTALAAGDTVYVGLVTSAATADVNRVQRVIDRWDARAGSNTPRQITDVTIAKVEEAKLPDRTYTYVGVVLSPEQQRARAVRQVEEQAVENGQLRGSQFVSPEARAAADIETGRIKLSPGIALRVVQKAGVSKEETIRNLNRVLQVRGGGDFEYNRTIEGDTATVLAELKKKHFPIAQLEARMDSRFFPFKPSLEKPLRERLAKAKLVRRLAKAGAAVGAAVTAVNFYKWLEAAPRRSMESYSQEGSEPQPAATPPTGAVVPAQ